MPTYVHTTSGERVRTVAASSEDRRLRASTAWEAERATPAPVPGRPAEADRKDEWVSYALDRGVPSYEAHNMTKAELIERTGGDGA